eukprot:5051907-Lingulodinium_polyedra.AAC.1
MQVTSSSFVARGAMLADCRSSSEGKEVLPIPTFRQRKSTGQRTCCDRMTATRATVTFTTVMTTTMTASDALLKAT